MSIKRVSSPFVNAWQGLGFWSGCSLRNRLISTLKPTKDSFVTNLILGLCVLVSALVPIAAVYNLVLFTPGFREQGGAISLSPALLLVAVMAASFFRRVFVWPRLAIPAAETEQHFADGAFAMLAKNGGVRWALIGVSLGQVLVTAASLYFVTEHRVSGPLVIYLAVGLPALGALALATTATRAFHATDDRLSSGDTLLMAAQVSTNLTVVGFIVAGLIVYAATIAIGIAAFVLGGLILWRAFAGRTDPANTSGLFETARVPAAPQWHDASGQTHVDDAGQIRQAHTGILLGKVDGSGRVTGVDGSHAGTVGSDGQVR